MVFVKWHYSPKGLENSKRSDKLSSPTVRKAQTLRGHRIPQEANAISRKAKGNYRKKQKGTTGGPEQGPPEVEE